MFPSRALVLVLSLVTVLAAGAPAVASELVRPVSARVSSAPAVGAAPPAAEAVPEGDPIDRLRTRLAERLSGVKVTNTAAALDLRVPTRPPPSSASARSGAPRADTGATRASTRAAPPWGYVGEGGPQAWGDLRPDFALCKSGQRQSPIDLRLGMAVDLEPIHFNYQLSSFGVIDTGHTVQVNIAPGNFMELGGRRFELHRLQFHRPSEVRIDGRQFAMSANLHHKASDGRQAVVAVVLDPGSAQPVVQTVWNNLPLEKNYEVKARVNIDLNQLLPADRRYYTYMGSLTTPPCTENVQRVVMRHPVTMSPEQLDIFARMYPMNSRPLQAANGRRILQSN